MKEGEKQWLIIQNIIIWNYQNGSEYYDIKVANTNNKIIDEKLYEKVDKVPNKELSTNDFTNGYKQKLDSLKNYDDTEIKNKDTEQDSKIEELQNQKTKLEKELKEMQEDYYQTSIRGQASGEYIHVEDSSGARCKIGIYGNSEQETRSGKNLFKPLNITSNGITTTYDKDGVGTIKGTSTNMWANISANVIYLYPAGNYVLSIDEPKTFNINLKGIYTDEEIFEFVIPAGSKTKNVAFKKEVYSMYAFISGFAVGTTLDDTIKIQLEKGSTATDFEQYGLMPSPDYPSEIKTVGSNVNLLDKSKFVFNKALNNDTGEIRTSTSGNWYGTEEYIDFRKYAGKTISLSNRTTVAFYDTNKKFISYIAATQSPTGTVPQNTAYIRADVYKDYYDVVKLVEGTEVGEYSKYGMGSVKLTKCNKNILRLPEVTEKEINGVKYSIREGKLYLNGIATADTRIDIPINLTLRTGKYTHSRNNIEIKKIYLSLDNINHTMLNNNLTEKTWETTEDTNYTNYLIWFSKETEFNNIILNLQIEESIIATPYKEHQEQSYIMPVQKEMLEGDYFDWDNEEEVHVWGNVVANGTETINKNSNSEFFSITKSMSQFDTSANAIKQSISNYGTGTTLALGSGNTNNKYSFDASTIYLDCYNSNINTVEKLKVQLTKSNMKIYTKLSTPTRLKFTDEQKAVAKELNNARTYKNVTNITTDSKAILSLDYVKDQETQNQKMQNEIDEIKQLLSTTQTSAMLLDNLQKEVESEVE